MAHGPRCVERCQSRPRAKRVDGNVRPTRRERGHAVASKHDIPVPRVEMNREPRHECGRLTKRRCCVVGRLSQLSEPSHAFDTEDRALLRGIRLERKTENGTETRRPNLDDRLRPDDVVQVPESWF